MARGLESITNDNEQKIEDYPFIVYILNYNATTKTRSVKCTGSIINNYWVLTAAQCFSTSDASEKNRIKARTEIVWGKESFSNEDTSFYKTMQGSGDVFLHPDFSSATDIDTYKNDIALIRTPMGFNFDSKTSPIYLRTSELSFTEGQEATVVGVGEGGLLYPETKLRIETVKIQDIFACKYYYGWPSTKNKICAKGHSTCVGDEGGPMIMDINGVINLVAITSISLYNRYCGSWHGNPELFTSVWLYNDWITQTMNDWKEPHEDPVNRTGCPDPFDTHSDCPNRL